MAELTNLIRRMRTYRSTALEMTFICALLIVSFIARYKAASIVDRGDPRIATTDSALHALVGETDTQSDSVDPRVMRLTERRRDLQKALHDRIDFWYNIRAASFFAFLLATVLGLISFVRYVLSVDDDPTSILKGKRGGG